jgi:Protein of unknown function (DUF1501)
VRARGKIAQRHEDLKQRGLPDSTPVIRGGEFGRKEILARPSAVFFR